MQSPILVGSNELRKSGFDYTDIAKVHGDFFLKSDFKIQSFDRIFQSIK